MSGAKLESGPWTKEKLQDVLNSPLATRTGYAYVDVVYETYSNIRQMNNWAYSMGWRGALIVSTKSMVFRRMSRG